MRVIGGQFRSRLLAAPQGSATRPTSDRLRETLFNVLGMRVPGARFADLYAGSGAVGIEALSRGAVACLFVERAPSAIASIRKNLASLGMASPVTIDSASVLRALQNALRQDRVFDLIFLDPPYEAAEEYTATLRYLAEQHGKLLSPGGQVIAEHARRTTLPETFGPLYRYRLLEQGDAALSFYAIPVEERPQETL